MKKLLITGFEPFGGAEENPSWLAVSALPEQIGEYRLYKLRLPTVFGAAAQEVLAQAAQIHPDVILSVGVAAERDAVTPERIAVNIRDARIPDNAGNQPRGDFVEPHGPAAYFSTLPVEAMTQAIRDAQVPAAVSNSAGTFVCNDVMYAVLHACADTQTRAGFLHIPNHRGTPSLPLETTVRALTAAITALDHTDPPPHRGNITE